MVLVLVKPFVAVISKQFVLAKGCIYEAIHKRGGQVHASRVNLRATATKPCVEEEEDRLRIGPESNTVCSLSRSEVSL